MVTEASEALSLDAALEMFALADRTEKAAKKMRETARTAILKYASNNAIERITNQDKSVAVRIEVPTKTTPAMFDANRTDEFFERLFEGGFADIAEGTFEVYRQFSEKSWLDLVRAQDDDRRFRLNYMLQQFILPEKKEPMAPRVSLL